MPLLPFLCQNWSPKSISSSQMTFAKHWKHCARPLSPFCVLSVSLGVTSLSQQSRPFSLSSGLALITQSSLGGAANARTISRVLRGRERAENHDHVPESLSVCTLGSTCISSFHTKHSKLQNLKKQGLELSWGKRTGGQVWGGGDKC